MSAFFLAHHPSLTVLAPLWIVLGGATLILLLDLLPLGRGRGSFLLLVGLLVLGGAAWALLYLYPSAAQSLCQGGVLLDNAALFVFGLILLILFFVFLFAAEGIETRELPPGETLALLLYSGGGMMLLAAAQSLLIFFLGLELMSIPLYVLTVSGGGGRWGTEAAFKYFLLGAFSSAILLMGLAFLYGASGTLLYRGLMPEGGGALARGPEIYAWIGLALTLAGFAFKIAAVPFHLWAPDVYQGAPTPVTAFMASGVKTAAFAAMFRLVIVALSPLHAGRSGAIYWICLLTMIWGNLAALAQGNVKRMLAYSSIAHAGYLLIAIAINDDLAPLGEPAAALFFYLGVYSLMTLGAFGVVAAVEKTGGGGSDFDDFSGLARRHPALAFSLAVMLFALAGFPPTAGFFAKFYLFKAALARGEFGLVIAAVLLSLLSVYYYLRLVYFMYMRPAAGVTARPPLLTSLATLVLAGLVLGVGLFPAGWLGMLERIFGFYFY